MYRILGGVMISLATYASNDIDDLFLVVSTSVNLNLTHHNSALNTIFYLLFQKHHYDKLHTAHTHQESTYCHTLSQKSHFWWHCQQTPLPQIFCMSYMYMAEIPSEREFLSQGTWLRPSKGFRQAGVSYSMLDDLFRPDRHSCRCHFPDVSVWTMQQTLAQEGLHGHHKCKVPLLARAHCRKRLEFAKNHAHWMVEDWHAAIFSDESKFMSFGSDGVQYCWRGLGEAYLHRNVLMSTWFYTYKLHSISYIFPTKTYMIQWCIHLPFTKDLQKSRVALFLVASVHKIVDIHCQPTPRAVIVTKPNLGNLSLKMIQKSFTK